MNNPIHYITIEGTVFEVDIQNQQLVERDRPMNTISFVDQMIDHGSHYDLGYDKEYKNSIDRANDFSETENWSLIRVPKLIELDPQGMAEKYHCTIADLQGKTDFEVIVDPQLLALRKNGIVPKIHVGDDQFFIRLVENELQPAGHRGPHIKLEELQYKDESKAYEGFYHTVKRQIVEIDPKLTEFPDHVVAIRIPNRFVLDPVVASKIYGFNERNTLRHSPIQKELRAELIPLSETGIPALIQRNREQLQLEHQQTANQLKPKRKLRF